MHLIKRSLKVLPVAAVAVGLLAPSSALASQPGGAECVFTGVTGSLSPAIPNIPTIGGSGSFTFGGSATCNVTHGATTAPVSANISASGSYSNIVCSTGSASGTASITFGAGSPIASASASFSIQFVGGQGVLQISSFTDNLGHRGQGAGEVTIVPSQGNCVTSPVGQFTVAGGFAAAAT